MQTWSQVNKLKMDKQTIDTKKSLVIYSYSISKNCIKEILTKIGVNCLFTNDAKKASLILGLTRQLDQNYQLKKLAIKRKIPIYCLKQINIYQLTKLMKFIMMN